MVSFEPGMKQWMCDGGWEWWAGGRWILWHHRQGVLCKAGGMRQEVDSRDEVMHSEMSDWWFLKKMYGGRERVTTDEERVPRGTEQRSGCADK